MYYILLAAIFLIDFAALTKRVANMLSTLLIPCVFAVIAVKNIIRIWFQVTIYVFS